MNRAEKGWQTRYTNEIAILDEKLEHLREELHTLFLDFVGKTAKYHDLTHERDAMQKELQRFQRKHKGGTSSE